MGDDSADELLLASLFFVCIYVDDVGAASIDDALFLSDGSEWFTERGGVRVRMTRAWLHAEAALGVIAHFGHSAAADKVVMPCLDMVYLGITLDMPSMGMSLSSSFAMNIWDAPR